jgi:hypothetical protein
VLRVNGVARSVQHLREQKVNAHQYSSNVVLGNGITLKGLPCFNELALVHDQTRRVLL